MIVLVFLPNSESIFLQIVDKLVRELSVEVKFANVFTAPVV
jgi:hypothetical protein